MSACANYIVLPVVYLHEHKRAKVETAIKAVNKKIVQLKIDKWLRVRTGQRALELEVDNEALEEVSRLDGCYVIKTDLPKDVADKQIILDRYKDLTEVERVFRTFKTDFLEVRPVYVQTEKSTRGHVLAVMLAYMIVRMRKGGSLGCGHLTGILTALPEFYALPRR